MSKKKENNMDIDGESISCKILQEILSEYGIPTSCSKSDQNILFIHELDTCFWTIEICRDSRITFIGRRVFSKTHDKSDDKRDLNGANSTNQLSTFYFEGDHTIAVRYSIIYTNGLSKQMVIDIWEKLKFEQKLFSAWWQHVRFNPI